MTDKPPARPAARPPARRPRAPRPAPRTAPPAPDAAATPPAPEVYTLLVQTGRAPDDGLPDGATGAALVCYAAALDEEEAVRETVAVLRTAGLSPLEVESYGSLAEREAGGHEIGDEDRALMARALEENAVIVAQMEPLHD